MARLYEYQGKQLLKGAKVPIPQGEVAATPQDKTKGTLMKSMTLEISIPSFGSISPRPRRRHRRVSQSQPSPPPNHD